MTGFIQALWQRLAMARPLRTAPIHVKVVTATENGKQTPADPIKITVVEVHT